MPKKNQSKASENNAEVKNKAADKTALSKAAVVEDAKVVIIEPDSTVPEVSDSVSESSDEEDVTSTDKVALEEPVAEIAPENSPEPKIEPKKADKSTSPKKKKDPIVVKAPKVQTTVAAAELPQSPLHHHGKRFALIFSTVVFVPILVWSILAISFGNYTVGDTKLSLIANRSTLSAAVSEHVKAYKIMISYPDGKQKSYSLSDMGYSVNLPASVSSLQKTQFSSFITWWKPKSGQIVYNVNQTKLNTFITKSLTITTQPATDAKLKIINGNITIVDSVAGKHYGLESPVNTIKNAVSNLQTKPLKLVLLAANPAITSAQLNSYKVKLNEIIKQDIVFNIANNQVSPTPTDIGNWLELTPNENAKTVDITVNSGKILSYLNKLAGNYIHPPKDEIDVKHSDGTIVKLVSGVNGVDITNKSTIATQISKDLLSAKGMQIDLPIANASYGKILAGEYDKWIEVDTTNKRMYAYEKTNLVRTFLISSGAPATPTVTGQFNIYAKQVQQDMRGWNVDGSKYFQPNVPWVNYFYKDYAIHGNYWRPLNYFGNINSSHGCVGIIPSDGEWMYNWAPIGTKVIVHT